MSKKIKKILIICFCSFVVVSGLSFLVYEFFVPKKVVINNSSDKYVVTIDGAVESPGDYVFNKPKTLREIIFVANVLTNADITLLDLEKVISEDYQVVIPYKVGAIKKIKWKDLYSAEQLINLGIKSSVAQTIINHRRQNEKTTWEEILALKGIGQVTLAQLKDIIDLS